MGIRLSIVRTFHLTHHAREHSGEIGTRAEEYMYFWNYARICGKYTYTRTNAQHVLYVHQDDKNE
jgi:hypothetical protein